MGIPKFYGSWLKKRASSFPGVLVNKIPVHVSSLLIDMNSVIHQAAQICYSYGDYENEQRKRYVETAPDKVLETQMFHTLGNKLLQIIFQVQPRINIVFAVDGVAPEAKMVQQRQRRFRYSSEGKFSPNWITPGTDFMKRLDDYLRKWIARNEYSLPPRVFYSSHMVPGEGEHKIMDLIREGKIKGDGAHVLYGLDADLIMLSLLSNLPEIYLMREDINDVIHIDNMKVMIKKLLQTPSSVTDFVLFVFLVGNDFVPITPALSDMTVSIDTMIKTYQKLKKPLTKAQDIILENLYEFLQLLSVEEPKLLQREARKKFEYPSRMLEVAIIDDNRTLDFNLFRDAWYTVALYDIGYDPQKLSQREIIHEVTNMCREYIKGMQWTLYYYTRGTFHVDPYWFYPYYHAPLIIDLGYSGIYEIPNMNHNTSPETFINTSVQLLTVLPSSKFIPKNLKKYFEKPKKFFIERDAKNNAWEGIAIIPFPNIKQFHISPEDLMKPDSLVEIIRNPKKQEEVDHIKRFKNFIATKRKDLRCKRNK
jgi:5'-3' exonuclease